MPTILIFFLIFSVLIISHEFGHFITARRVGMRVLEFGFGFPPRLFSWKRRGTEYTLNAIPFGGFVRILGEDGPEENPPSGHPDFGAFSLTAQAFVIAAGVLFNLALAWILLSVGFATGAPASFDEKYAAYIHDARIIVSNVGINTPAEGVGIKTGDTIISIKEGDDLIRVTESLDTKAIADFIDKAGEGEVLLTLKRGSEEIKIEVVPEANIVPGRFAIGITLDSIGTMKLPLHLAVWEGLRRTIDLSYLTLSAIGGLVYGALSGGADLSTLAGPVGIYTIVGEAGGLGFSYLLSLTALLSISIALINILPFPALDGGRLFFLLIEALRGAPLNPRFVKISNLFGFGLLLLIMVLISYHDFVRLGFLGT